MSPAALLLALALHGSVAASLWWVSPFKPTKPPQDAVMVTLEDAPPPSVTSSPADKPAEPSTAGPPEPAPPEPPRDQPQQQALAEPPPPSSAAPVEPSAAANPAEEVTPAEAPPPPAEAPQPPAETADYPTLRLPLPPWPTQPPPKAAQAPPRPPPPKPTPPPAPAPAPQPRSAPASIPAPPSSSADLLFGRGRARNTYLDQVARHTSRFRTYPRVALENRQAGRVVTRVTIARDGRILDIGIDTSSGWPAIDAAELDTIRRSAPLPPVPPDMPGDPLILHLPINYDLPLAVRNR